MLKVAIAAHDIRLDQCPSHVDGVTTIDGAPGLPAARKALDS
ncbi:hypothetical protein FHS85_000881 [Rhodoligotrophos appendicifer]|nr:hypothetical protein [Rhodoligotrophos appendicifer]